MISIETKLKVKDNTGAKIAKCIKIYKKPKGSIGDIILISIQKIKMKKNLKVLKGDVLKALIIQTVYKHKNIIQNFINFNENAVILLKENDQPIGSRILGPVPFFLRKKKQFKIISMAVNII